MFTTISDIDFMEHIRFKIIDTLDKSIPTNIKKIRINKHLDEINENILKDYTKKNPLVKNDKFSRYKSDKFLYVPDNASSELLLENEKLNAEIKILNTKIIKLKISLNEKDKNFYALTAQLEKIKKMQELNVSTLKSQCLPNKGNGTFIRVSRTSSPSNESSLLKSFKLDDSNEAQSFFNSFQDTLNNLAGLLKRFTRHGAKLQQFITIESPEMNSFLQNFQKESAEIEKTIDDIITPRFKCNSPGRDKPKEKANIINKNEPIGLRKINESLLRENKDLQGIINMNNHNILLYEQQIKSLKTQINNFKVIIDANEKQLQLQNDLSLYREKKQKNYEIIQKPEIVLTMQLINSISVENIFNYQNQSLFKEMRRQIVEKERELMKAKETILQLRTKKNYTEKSIQVEDGSSTHRLNSQISEQYLSKTVSLSKITSKFFTEELSSKENATFYLN